MSSVTCSCIISCLITSPQYFFGLPLPLLKPYITNFLHLLTNASTYLLFTCPNHLSFAFLNLPTTDAIPTFIWISSFLILLLLVWPHIHLNILIFATCIIWTWKFLTGLTTTLSNFLVSVVPFCHIRFLRQDSSTKTIWRSYLMYLSAWTMDFILVIFKFTWSQAKIYTSCEHILEFYVILFFKISLLGNLIYWTILLRIHIDPCKEDVSVVSSFIIKCLIYVLTLDWL